MNPLPALSGFTFRSLYQGRRLVAPLLLGLAPAVISLAVVVVRSQFDFATLRPEALYRFMVPAYFHPFLIMAAILFGSSAVADDAEDGSVVYLLIRPIRRGAVYLGKIGASVAATLVVMLASLGLTWIILRLGSEGALPLQLLLRDALWITAGAVGYSAAFGTAAILGKRPLQFAVAYLFLWEFPMAFVPTTLRFFTVSHYVLALMPHTSWWNSLITTFNMTTAPGAAVAGIAALAMVQLVLGSMRFERKEHLPTAGA